MKAPRLRAVFLAVSAITFSSSAHADIFLATSQGTNQILAYDTNGRFLRVFASAGGLLMPSGIAIGPDRNVYVSSTGNNQVLRYDLATGAPLGVFASGNGLSSPLSLAWGPDQNLYVASFGTARIFRYAGTTGALLRILGGPGEPLNSPGGMAFGPDGNLYVASTGTNQVLRYNPAAGFLNVFASGGGLRAPTGIAFGRDSHLYVSSAGSNQVLRYHGGTGAFLGVFASTGGMANPLGLTFGPDGHLYVANLNNQVLRYNGITGAYMDVFVAPGSGGLLSPISIAFAPEVVRPGVTGLEIVAGNLQESAAGTLFSQPLVVRVLGGPGTTIAQPVQFSVPGGKGSVEPGQALTDPQGLAYAQVRAGDITGPMLVIASVGQYVVTFTLTVRPPGPQFDINTIVSAAGGQTGAVSPGTIVQINGRGFAPPMQGCAAPRIAPEPLPYRLSGVSVQFGGMSAPIYNVCNFAPLGPEYVTVQVPFELPVGAVPVTVAGVTGVTTIPPVPVLPVAPGVFETQMADGLRRAVLVRPGGAFVSLENPARPGEVLHAYVTGLGAAAAPDSTRLATNQLGSPASTFAPLLPVIVGVNNAGANLVSVTYAPGMIGLFDVAFEVPSDTPAGTNIPFVVAAVVNDRLWFSNSSAMPVK